jgi:hypothetical protein
LTDVMGILRPGELVVIEAMDRLKARAPKERYAGIDDALPMRTVYEEAVGAATHAGPP